MMTPIARTPEELAREQIDAQLAACGWIVQDRRAMNISAGPGVAIRKFPFVGGEANYLPYANGRATATLQAIEIGNPKKGPSLLFSRPRQWNCHHDFRKERENNP